METSHEVELSIENKEKKKKKGFQSSEDRILMECYTIKNLFYWQVSDFILCQYLQCFDLKKVDQICSYIESRINIPQQVTEI